MQQSRLATVRVPDDGHHREVDPAAAFATQRSLLADLLDVVVEFADPMTDATAIALQLLLARTAGADTGAQPGEVPTALQPWQQMVQLRRLHLQPAFLGARALGKDVEDQLGAVDDLHLELLLQVALLPR